MNVFQVLSVLCLSYEMNAMSYEACPKISLRNGHVLPVYENLLMVRYRCQRGFIRYGASLSMCTHGVWYPAAPTCVKKGCLKPNAIRKGKIHEAKVDAMKGALISFTCDRGFLRKGADRLLCDGNKWNGEPPCCELFKDAPIICDFEDEFLCGWRQDNNDDFDWIRWRGETPTKDTGPITDYTTNTTAGHYVFLESSPPQRKHDKANLISMTFPLEYATGWCLEFRYHMFGSDVGELSVFVTQPNIDTTKMNTSQRLLHLTGQQGMEWLFAKVFIPDQPRAFQIVIQGTSGEFYGDIALDDLTITRCSDMSLEVEEQTKTREMDRTGTSLDEFPSKAKGLSTKETQRLMTDCETGGQKKTKSMKLKKQGKIKKLKNCKKDRVQNKSKLGKRRKGKIGSDGT